MRLGADRRRMHDANTGVRSQGALCGFGGAVAWPYGCSGTARPTQPNPPKPKIQIAQAIMRMAPPIMMRS